MTTTRRGPRLPTGRKESAIQAAVMGCLRAYGILCWPQNREKGGRNRAAHYGFKGIPDIGGVMPGGRAIHVEVKCGREKPSPYQVAAQEMLRKQGAVVFTVWNIEDVGKGLGRC